jgi:probable rRNA maturation factor
MKIELINQQRVKRLNLKEFEFFLSKTLSFLKIPSKKISVLFCDNVQIKKLNRKFFKRDSDTDVIAFPIYDEFDKDYLGEIVTSVEKAVETSVKYGSSWKKELLLYIIHGLLHLLGYDDIKPQDRLVMERKQKCILDKLFTDYD